MGELVDLRRVNAAMYCGKRPCPWRACRHHMATAPIPAGGSMPSPARVRLSVLQPHTCSLDLAGTGPMTHAKIGRAMAMSESNAKRSGDRALRKVAKRLGVSVGEAKRRLESLSTWAQGGLNS